MNKENQISPEASRKFKSLFEAISDNTSIAIYETDADGKCLLVNKQWCNFAGITKEDALGDGWRQGLHPDDRERIFKLWNQYAKTRKPWNFEYRFRTPENVVTWVWGTAVPLTNEHGEIAGYLGINMDITERKQAEDALRESEEGFLNMFEMANEAIFVIGMDGTFKDANKKASEIYGYTHDEFLTINARKLIHPDYFHLFQKHTKVLLKQKYFSTEAINICKDGREIYVNINATTIDYKGEKCFSNFITDITEKKKAEEDLNKRMRQMETFNRIAVDRELKMVELKKEINSLLEKAGLAKKYTTSV